MEKPFFWDVEFQQREAQGATPDCVEALTAFVDKYRDAANIYEAAGRLYRDIFLEDHKPSNGVLAPRELPEEERGLFFLAVTLGNLPTIRETSARFGLQEEYVTELCQWLHGATQIFAAGNHGLPGIDPRQIHWVRLYCTGALFRMDRLEFRIAAQWMQPIFFRHKISGKLTALAPNGWFIHADGRRINAHETPGMATVITSYLETDSHYSGTGIASDGTVNVLKRTLLSKEEYTPELANDEVILDFHIPGGGGMTLERVKNSFLTAKEFFERHFNRTVKGFSCSSWIFNPYLAERLPEANTTLLRSQGYWYPSWHSGKDGVFFIFGRDDEDVRNYPGDNRMRRAFQNVVSEGGELIAQGFYFSMAELERFGEGDTIYRH